MTEKVIHPIEPIYDENSEILILGSFPSVKSREQVFYYINKFYCIDGGQKIEHSNKSTGAVNITVTHIPTGIQKSFRIWSGDAIWCFKTASVRLSAESAEVIKVKDPQSSTALGFGEQLWYTEYAGAGYYYIHSLHVEDSNMGDNNVLTLSDDGSLSLSLKSDLSAKKWKIQSNGDGTYNIFSQKYPTYKIDTIDTDNGNRLLATNTGSISWSLEPAMSLALPDCVLNGGYNDNSTIHHIKIVVDTGTFTSGTRLKDLLTTESNYDDLFGIWNNITSKIVIHYPNEDTSSLTNVFTITIKEASLDDGVVGETLGNNASGWLNSNWNYCVIKMATSYRNADVALLKKVIVHELGHALKLSHTFSEDNIIPNPMTTYPSYINNAVIRFFTPSDYDYYKGKRHDSAHEPVIHYKPEEHEVITVMTYNDDSMTHTPSFLDKLSIIFKWGV